MSLEKAQLKIMIANSLGADLEDRMEGERKSTHELLGASTALKQAAQKVPHDLCALVDRDLNEEKIKEGLSALEVAGLIKKYLTRAGDFLGHLGDVEQQKAIVLGGRVAGLEDAMKMVLKMRTDEANKLKEVVQTLDRAEAGDETALVDTRSPAAQARAEHGSVAERRARAMIEKGGNNKPASKSIDEMSEAELEAHLLAGGE